MLLFAYGTLQDRAVQMANFGRELDGRPDSLTGYALFSIEIADPTIVALSGKTHHKIAQRSADPDDEVPGTVYTVSPQELAAADRYEVSDYTRALVTLKSGAQAWIYVRA